MMSNGKTFVPGVALMLDHTKCSASTGIHEASDADGSEDRPWGITYGQGVLDDNGYWSKPCFKCAREAEKRHSVPIDSYWPWSSPRLSHVDQPVTTETAYRIRYHRGLKLPVTRRETDAYIPLRDDVQYEDEKVREIAVKQHIARRELERLDRELKKLYLIDRAKRNRELT